MKNILRVFWEKYEKRYSLYTGISTVLFLLQLVHLYWLTTHVVLYRLVGASFFDPNYFWQMVIIFVDYMEIPAIMGTSLVYIHVLQKKWNYKDLLLLLMLNSQWLHLFWISDEFVISVFRGGNTQTVLPYWLAWVAIFIDYLELPVIYDTTRKFIASLMINKKLPTREN